MNQTEFPPVEISQQFIVPAENIFSAWTEPEIIKKWMFKGEGYGVEKAMINLEPNGEFSIITKDPNGELLNHFGTYHEIARPSLLSFSLQAPHHFPGVSSVIVRIMPTEQGAVMMFLQTGIDPSVVEDAWRKMFEKLDQVVNDL
jgi:uncharacterized protein YndB with AHSA1/START domain